MPSMKYGNPPRMMLETFEEHLNRIADRHEGPVMIDVTAHAHIFGRPHGAYYYEKIVQTAASTRDIWIATRLEIAQFILGRKEPA
jgi:hypothetical protein